MWFRPVRTPDRIRTGATALRGRRARPLHNGGPSDPASKTAGATRAVLAGRICTPDRIRTGATALRGRRARPLHNGGLADVLRGADKLCELAYQDSNLD